MKIQILDYGSGNFFSIRESLNRNSGKNIESFISSSYKKGTIDALVLPGVGSFATAQQILSENREAILADIKDNQMRVLGICLGMQLMFQISEEGEGEGLGLFEGDVKRFEPSPARKVPHMGWNTIDIVGGKESSLLRGVHESSWVYYVHSYYPVPSDEEIASAWTDYEGLRFPAVIESDGRIFGTQFHPEKSHTTGSSIISNFLRAISK